MTKQIYPEPTVGVFILNSCDELLLLKSHKWPDQFVIPGGHIELGEQILDAVRREAKEETGLEVTDLEFICFQEFIYDPSFWKPRHFIFFDYICKTNSSNVILNDEAESFLWIPLKDVLNFPVDKYTRVSIEKYLECKSLLSK